MEQEQEKYKTRMMKKTAQGDKGNTIRKMHPRGELQRKKPQAEQQDRRTATYKDPMEKCDKNMPNMNQTHTLGKVIEEMIDREDNKDETQSQSQRKQMTHEATRTCTNRPPPTTKTTRPKKGQEETVNNDSSTQ